MTEMDFVKELAIHWEFNPLNFQSIDIKVCILNSTFSQVTKIDIEKN
ncbi:hypothetical protein GCM10007940_42680 [Portibacter lacus]|uniref:Uncharacterized protein n=1 Tax=Portibacter lacus TaxID=1099794 RepID=A0AA37ST83_9BACT|nr:hypothetical protein GCM10007940_42680 [Portibacter lacus]